MNQVTNDDIDLRPVLKYLGARLKKVMVLSIIAASIAFIFSLTISDSFEATAVIYPVDTTGSEVGSNLGMLAGGLGLNIGGNGETEKIKSMLTSKRFITNLINEYDLKKTLYEKRWDLEKNSWKPAGFVGRVLYFFTGNEDLRKEPTDLSAYNKFVRNNYQVVDNYKNALIEIKMRCEKPTDCVSWSNKIINDINKYVQTQAIQESEISIDYLSNEIGKTPVVEVKNLLNQLVQQHVQNIAIAKSKSQFAFEIIDPPVTPEEPVSPNRLTILIITFMASMFLILGFYLIRFLITESE